MPAHLPPFCLLRFRLLHTHAQTHTLARTHPTARSWSTRCPTAPNSLTFSTSPHALARTHTHARTHARTHAQTHHSKELVYQMPYCAKASACMVRCGEVERSRDRARGKEGARGVRTRARHQLCALCRIGGTFRELAGWREGGRGHSLLLGTLPPSRQPSAHEDEDGRYCTCDWCMCARVCVDMLYM